MNFRSLLSLSIVAAVLGASGPVWADGAAPAKVPSDIENQNLKIDVDFQKGEIDVKNHDLTVEAGAFGNSAGAKGAVVSAKFSAPRFINGEVKPDNSFGLQADPNLAIEVKYDRDTHQIISIDAKALRIAGNFQAMGRNDTSASDAEEWAKRCDGDRIYFRYDDYHRGRCYDRKPSGTISADWLNAQLVYRDDKVMGIKMAGVEFGGFFPAFQSSSGHGALKINGVNTDFCYALDAMKILYGQASVGGEKGTTALKFVDAKACAGVQLGQVGHLYDEAKLEAGMLYAKTTDYIRFSNTAGLEKIGGTPLGVGYTYSISSKHNDEEGTKIVREHMFTVKGAF